MLGFLVIEIFFVNAQTIDLFESNLALNANLQSASALRQSTGISIKMFAHDIKRPISLAETLVEMLFETKDLKSFEKLRSRFPTEIRSAKERINSMLRELNELGESNFQSSNRLKTSIKKSVPTSIRYFSSDFKKVSIKIDFQHNCEVFCDESKLERVVSNIVENALKAMDKKGQISITSSEDNRFVFLSIKNTNSSISENEIKKIFDIFYTNSKKSNSGLGLYITNSLVRGWGGTISCQSEVNQNWVEFKFSIPKSKEQDNHTISENLR